MKYYLLSWYNVAVLNTAAKTTQCLPQRKHQHPTYICFQAYVKLSYPMVAGRSWLYCRKCEKKPQPTKFTKIRVMKALVWPVGSWTLRKHKETHLDAFEMQGLKDSAGFVGSTENK